MTDDELLEILSSTVTINGYGTKLWYNTAGDLHRVYGPAIEYANGTKYWYQNGKLHREDGPAVEYPNGDKEWFLNGNRVDPN